jgi:transcriptional regulator
MKAEALKGHLDLLLLSAVESRPSHGYAIAEVLRARSAGAFDLAEGTLYPALHRLERAQLLSSRWAEVGGRRRRLYALTAAGRKALAARRQEWRAFAGAMQAVVEVTG